MISCLIQPNFEHRLLVKTIIIKSYITQHRNWIKIWNFRTNISVVGIVTILIKIHTQKCVKKHFSLANGHKNGFTERIVQCTKSRRVVRVGGATPKKKPKQVVKCLHVFLKQLNLNWNIYHIMPSKQWTAITVHTQLNKQYINFIIELFNIRSAKVSDTLMCVTVCACILSISFSTCVNFF